VHLDKLLAEAKIIPAINQMEYHPYLIQQPLVDYCHAKGILYQAWGPLILESFEEPVLKEIGRKYNKNEAQIILRWDLQKGFLLFQNQLNMKE
jgi:diketogulonate reductase-like aldo/keto reductase